jgi:GT2 family glycosyltransferase/SAM-dependent methyltransferase
MTLHGILRSCWRRLLAAIRREGLAEALRLGLRALRARLQGPVPLFQLKAWLAYYEHREKIVRRQAIAMPPPDGPRVSILILTWNNLLLNQICLRSIYANTTDPDYEVVVVDNGSSDGTPAWLRALANSHKNLRLILNAENRGFAAANNQAAREAGGEYLIFLNNDTVVPAGWVDGLAAHLQDPSIGLVGPVTNATGNEARIATEYAAPAEMEAFAAARAAAMRGQAFDIRMLAFYCVMARKAEFTALGGLDERFGVGMFEDEDLALRFKAAGLRVVCAENVFIHHFWRQSFNKLADARYQELFEENKVKFEEKWGWPWVPYQAHRHPSSSAAEPAEGGPPSGLEAQGGLRIPRPQDGGCGSRTAEGSTPGYACTRAQGPALKLPRGKKPWGTLHFRCNICGRTCESLITDLQREKRSCACGSTVRLRAIVHRLSTELFGHSLALPDFPSRPELHGLGMSDVHYADLLRRKFNYVNSFYHKEPRLDIAAPLEAGREGAFDFVISTEVFEHIAPPVQAGFQNLRRLLKPSGVLIFSVPYTLDPATIEHFPELHEYEIIARLGAAPVLKNTTVDGRQQIFRDLVFHGGDGATLEMRVFSESGLREEFEQAGFARVDISSEPCWEHGIYWEQPWSLPLTARPSAPD